MASFMGRRQAENWKSLFSGVWGAEHRREVTVDNKLSRCMGHKHLALEIAKGEAVRKGFFYPCQNKEEFYFWKCSDKNTYHLMSTY